MKPRHLHTAPIVSRLLLLPGVVLLIMQLTGCVATQSVMIENVDASMQIAAPPITLTDHPQPNQFTVTPHLSLPAKQRVTGILRVTDEFSNDETADSESANFRWNIPRMNGGVNLDYTVSRHTAVNFGLSLATLGGLTYGGWSAAMAFFNEKENAAFRFDIGLHSTPVKYRATSRIITTYDNGRAADTVRCSDRGVESYPNIYGSLTLNTTRKAWPVNLFLQTYITKQRFIDYTPHASDTYMEYGGAEVSSSHWMVGLTPGISLAVMEDVRLVVGERIIFPFDIVDQTPNPLLQFHMQLDLTL